MKLLGNVVVLSLVLVLAGGNETANSAVKKKHHHIRGKVVAVHHGKDGKGSITIRVHHKKKGAGAVQAGGATVVKTFHVTAATRFETIVRAGKGQNQKEAATFMNVHKGEHVLIVPGGKKHHGARMVAIVHKAKGQKKIQR